MKNCLFVVFYLLIFGGAFEQAYCSTLSSNEATSSEPQSFISICFISECIACCDDAWIVVSIPELGIDTTMYNPVNANSQGDEICVILYIPSGITGEFYGTIVGEWGNCQQCNAGSPCVAGGLYSYSFTVEIPCEVTSIRHTSVCQGDVYHDIQWDSSGIWRDTLYSQSGCDSIVIDSITVIPEIIIYKEVYVCPGDILFGAIITIDTVFIETITLPATRCDSTTLWNVTILDRPKASIIIEHACGSTLITIVPDTVSSYDYFWSDGDTNNRKRFIVDQTIQLTISNSFGCETDTTLIINVWKEPQLRLTTTHQQVQLGDEVTVTTTHTDGNLIWDATAENKSLHKDRFTFVADVLGNVTIHVTLIDDNGCSIERDIIIQVIPNYNVYIPSAFSPNNDGNNDTFTIYASAHVRQIKKLFIFDRWGNWVFKNENFEPNNPSLGWHGMFRGIYMDANVFVYLVEIEFIDGKIKIFKGDVTLAK